MFQSFVKLSDILFFSLIRVEVSYSAGTVEIVVLKGALVYVVQTLLDTSLTLGDVVNKEALKIAFLVKEESTLTIFEIISKIANKFSSIWKYLLSSLLFLSIFPFATICPNIIIPINIVILPILIMSKTIRKILSPFTLVIASIGFNHVSETVSFVVLPDSYVIQPAIVEHNPIARSYFDVFFTKKNAMVFKDGLLPFIDTRPIFGYLSMSMKFL